MSLTRIPAIRLLLPAIVTILVGAACGGGETTPTPRAPTPAPTATAVTTPAPTATAPPGATPTPVGAHPIATPAAPAATPTATAPPAATPTPVPVAPTATPVPATPSAQPKLGGRLALRAIRSFLFDTFDAAALSAHYTTMSMLNQLVMPDPYDLKTIVGDLAQGYELSADGKVYTFRLRQGVQWHDGKPFTSRDIAYNLDKAVHPDTPRKTYHAARFALVQTVETPDDSTVKITLQRPSARFLPNIAISPFLIYPAHLPNIDDWAKSPVGTGPFKFARHVTDVTLSVDRSPGYWKKGLPYLDGLDFTVIVDPALAEAAFRSGKSLTTNDGYDENWFSFKVDVLKKQFPDLEVRTYVPNRQELYFSQKAPWTDQRVRQAINLAFDRAQYIPLYRSGFANLGEPLASFMVPPHLGGQYGIPKAEMEKTPGFRTDGKAEDIAAAKKLLADAGVGPSSKVVLLGGTFFRNSAEAAQAVLRQTTGLNVTLDIEQDATDRLINGNFDLNVLSATFLLDEPFDSLRSLTVGAGNLQKWVNPKIDAMLNEQDITLDPAKRKQMLLDLQKEAYAWAQPIPIGWTIGAWGFRAAVKNMPQLLNVGSPFFKWEQVWVDR